MPNEQDPNGNGNGGHPAGDLDLAWRISEWASAGERLLRLVVRVGDRVPPSGPGPAAELSQLLEATDEQFDRLAEAWKTVLRPALKKFEGAPIPPLTFL